MQPLILITRPEIAAIQFADQLRGHLGCGVPLVLSPILRIDPCGTVPDVSGVTHLIFTSRNGVTAFAAQTNRRDIPCYTVGDATAQAARLAGLQATSCAGTADDLVAQIISDGITGPCLHLRGEHAVGDIAARLTAAGIQAQDAVLYRQMPEPLSPQVNAVLQQDAPVILPLFSPRSAKLLFATTQATAPLWVVALSENVANAVPIAQSNKIFVADRPDTEAMIDTILRVLEIGNPLEGGNPAQ